MKAYLKNFRQSPRKVRLVTDAVKGKSVAQADTELSFMPKKAARIIQKLIRSAAQNAVNNDGEKFEDLKIENIEVNQGVTLKRHRARARGSAFPINKRCSNVTVTLVKKEEKKVVEEPKKVEAKKAAPKKTAKKAAPKKAVKKATTKKTKVETTKETKETK